MSEKITVKPDKFSIANLLEEVKEGIIKIPLFQRDFVWKEFQMLELLDSISKGYPIGSLLLWQPNDEYDFHKNIGPYTIQENPNNRSTNYVLDGFQRITTLFSLLTNPSDYGFTFESVGKKYNIYYDLEENVFKHKHSIDKKRPSYTYIPAYRIIEPYQYIDFMRDIEKLCEDKHEAKRLIDNIKNINKTINDYQIPYIVIKGGSIESAVQIFSRTNSTGTTIDADYMITALNYNKENKFLLSEKITEFINGLSKYNFNKIKRDVILNCIKTNSTNKVYFDVDVKSIKDIKFEETYLNSFKSIERAIKFLYKELYVINQSLLPYPIQLIFLSEYFNVCNDNTGNNENLKRWFWITTYTNYFTSPLNPQRKAFSTFIEFAKGLNSFDNSIYKVNEDDVFEATEYPEKLNFTGVRPKALQLFMLNQIVQKTDIDYSEGIKEFCIFNKKDKTPANIILRLSSEFDKSDSLYKNTDYFIKNNGVDELEKYFINEEAKKLYIEGNEDDFLRCRTNLIQKAEKDFLEKMGVIYNFDKE